MTKKSGLKLQIAGITVIFLFTFTRGIAQTPEAKIKQIYLDNLVRLAVEALNDSCTNVALCEVPVDPYIHGEFKLVSDSGGVKRYSYSPDAGLLKVAIKCLLRESDKIDSLIILTNPVRNHTGSVETQFPLVYLYPCSKWIIFFDTPYRMGRKYDVSAMEELDEYEEKLKNQVDLNPNNYFAIFENDCAFCTYFPEDAKYPPMFIYSDGLVDDFKTIIELQKNPSLLSESRDSYDNYYNLMKEELSRRVFSGLFENPAKE